MLSFVLNLDILNGDTCWLKVSHEITANAIGQWLSHFMILLELKNLLSNSLTVVGKPK